MRTIETIVYTFDELSEQAKERAREWHRNGLEYSWQHENRESLEAFSKAFGIRPDWSAIVWGYSYCRPNRTGYGEPRNEETGEEISGLRLRTYLLNNFGHLLTIGKPYGKLEIKPSGKYDYKRRSRAVKVDRDCPFTGYCFDEDLLDPIREHIKAPNPETTYSELIQACLDSWVEAYVKDWEYTLSDESVDESIRCNDYEFTKDGAIA